jgi:diketogulonate reductase-like aldo/keto reductase
MAQRVFGTLRLGKMTYDMVRTYVKQCMADGSVCSIDTATLYRCQEEVMRAISDCIKDGEAKRTDIILTTKVAPCGALRKINPKDVHTIFALVKKYELEYLDYLLLHWPDAEYKEDWKLLISLTAEYPCRHLGVSNFHAKHLEEIDGEIPLVNQLEAHPWFYRPELLEYCLDREIIVSGHSSLAKFEKSGNEMVKKLVLKYTGKTDIKYEAPILLAWSRAHDMLPIFRTCSTEKLGIDCLAISLSEKDVEALDGLNKNGIYATHPQYA